ncbi:hypothetical protein E4K73_09975 [Streptomyces sp. IB201691-2A2]|nr:hypothetical protein E4K73_09975 [Streptomyces sp. IB201691-2A2]
MGLAAFPPPPPLPSSVPSGGLAPRPPYRAERARPQTPDGPGGAPPQPPNGASGAPGGML